MKEKNIKIRVAIIGCGRISEKHFVAIDDHSSDMELVAICDNNPAVLDNYQKKYNVRSFALLENLLEEIKLDLVILCTPSGHHSAQAIMASNHGVHVMTEKPMATRWHDGIAMVKACDQNNTRLFVVKQNRHNKTLQLLKRAIKEKRFGRIYMVNINVFWTRPQEYYDSDDWRGTWELDGGAFMNQASHYVDLVDWLIGPVDSIQAITSTLARDIEVEDTGVLNIKWRNGALGSMNVTMLTFPKNYEGSITIIGEKGTVKVSGIAVNEIEKWEFLEPMDYDAEVADASYETTSVYGFGHSAYYKNIINTLKGLEKPQTDGREGLKSLEILIAAYRSARDGRSVSLPLEY